MSKNRAERLAAPRLTSNLKPLIETVTGGTWEVQEYTTGDGLSGVTVVSRGGPEFDIADTGFVSEVHADDYPEFLANARLFAASKEMYRALDRLKNAAWEALNNPEAKQHLSLIGYLIEAANRAEEVLADARGDAR